MKKNWLKLGISMVLMLFLLHLNIFREKIKSGELKINKYPFRNKEKQPVGIPQGLPISATLANLYLLDFDKAILNDLIISKGCYYRRYSDDIIVVCKKNEAEYINKYVEAKIKEFKVEVSVSKTERFDFKKESTSKISCTKTTNNGQLKNAPLIYLGFEYNGNNTLVKSANLAKFYRRMIDSIKRKAKRAKKEAESKSETKRVIFRRQLYKLYITQPFGKTKVSTRHKKLVKNHFGEFRIVSIPKKKILRSNYLSYIKRASEIMNEPAIAKQIRNHKQIFNQAIIKHLNR